MRKTTRGLLAFALLGAAGTAGASVLTFDDLTTAAGYTYGQAMLPAYDGFAFSGWYIDPNCSGAGFTGSTCNSYPYTPASAPTTLYTFGNASISAPTPFVFDGASFTGYASASYQFELFLGGELVAVSSLLTTSATPTFLASGYGGLVDTVVVVGSLTQNGVMDNFTYGTTPVGPVPEPATLGLVGAGLVAGAFARRRRRA